MINAFLSPTHSILLFCSSFYDFIVIISCSTLPSLLKFKDFCTSYSSHVRFGGVCSWNGSRQSCVKVFNIIYYVQLEYILVLHASTRFHFIYFLFPSFSKYPILRKTRKGPLQQSQFNILLRKLIPMFEQCSKL